MKPYTVIAINDSTGQTICDHVEANNGIHAFFVAAQTRTGFSMIVALPGHQTEGEGELIFPGDSAVASSTILSQPEVFGPISSEGD